MKTLNNQYMQMVLRDGKTSGCFQKGVKRLHDMAKRLQSRYTIVIVCRNNEVHLLEADIAALTEDRNIYLSRGSVPLLGEQTKQ